MALCRAQRIHTIHLLRLLNQSEESILKNWLVYELSVNQLVEITQWKQPMVSKHLGVLKEAGLVSERRRGRQRLYQVNANALQPIQMWVRQFENHWNNQFDQLGDYLSQLHSKGDSSERNEC